MLRQYIDAGFCLIPQSKDGFPLVKWGQYCDRMPTVEELGHADAASFGLLCGKVSNVIAIDVDTDDNAKISLFLECATVRKVGSKGYTAFFKYNGEVSKSWKSNGKVICELLSDKRLTTIPPSPHRVTGKPYVWQGQDLLGADLPTLPEDFIAFMDIKYPAPVYTYTSHKYEERGEIDCNDMLRFISADMCREDWVKIGMALRHEYGDSARGLWHDWSRQSTKYNQKDADNAWRSFNGNGVSIGTLIHMALEGGYRFPVKEEKEAIVNAPNSPAIKWPKAHGLVGEITEWIMDTAYMPQYPLALAAALAFVGALKGHRVQTETGLRTNLLILSVAPSGSGKDHPRKCIEILARDTALSHLIGGEPASGSGLVDGLFNAGGRQLIQLDEMGRFLKGATSSTAQGFQTEILTNIMRLFGTAASVYHGKSYANNGNKKVEPRNIDQPCLSINGSTTANRLHESLTGADVIDGWLNRWIVVETKEEVEGIKGKGRVDEAPEHLVQMVKSIQGWPIQDNTSPFSRDINIRIQPKVVPFNVGAYQLLELYEDQFKTLRKTTNDPEGLGMLWARAPEHMKKIALIVAGYDAIMEQDVEFAFQLVKLCVTLVESAVNEFVASSEFERNKKRILAIIKGKGGEASLRIIAANSHLLQRVYKELLVTLEESGIIEGFKRQGKMFYRILS